MSSARTVDPLARSTRAQRILDVAGELLLRWGYKRLTMDDVAREARIGKGTIYLHWSTRETLFQAVLDREILAVLDHLAQAIQCEPRNALPHRLGAVYFDAIMRRPLVRAIFQMDREVLGKLLEHELHRAPELANIRVDFMRFLQQQAVLRRDLSPEELTYTFRTLLLGFFLADPWLGDEQTNLERKVELVAMLLRSAFEVDESPSEEVVMALAQRVLALIADARASGARLLAQLGRAGPVQGAH